MAEQKRRPTIAGFVPGEVADHYEVEHDQENRVVRLGLKGSGEEPSEISIGYVDPLFWYRAGFAAAVADKGDRPATGGTRTPPPRT